MTYDVLPFGDKWLYLVINFAAISIPFFAGFDRRLKFYNEWKYLFPSLALTMLIFIPWDMLKTSLGVWGFNPKYTLGINIGNLPLEEWLFFITIPYACVFTYHSLNYLFKCRLNNRIVQLVLLFSGILLFFAGVFFYQKLYTCVTFISTGIFLLFHYFHLRKEYSGRFLRMYLITLIPFFVVNGFLTGMMIPQEVVYYNNSENLGIRLGTIPIEDMVYGLLMLFMNVTWFEFFKNRYQRK